MHFSSFKICSQFFFVSAILHHISLLRLLPKSYFKISTFKPNFLCSSSFKMDLTNCEYNTHLQQIQKNHELNSLKEYNILIWITGRRLTIFIISFLKQDLTTILLIKYFKYYNISIYDGYLRSNRMKNKHNIETFCNNSLY